MNVYIYLHIYIYIYSHLQNIVQKLLLVSLITFSRLPSSSCKRLNFQFIFRGLQGFFQGHRKRQISSSCGVGKRVLHSFGNVCRHAGMGATRPGTSVGGWGILLMLSVAFFTLLGEAGS